MSTNIPKISARFETTLASSMAASDTSFNLTAATDKAGNALSGIYGFVIDNGSASEEFIIGTVSGTGVTSVARGLDPANPQTTVTALQQSHRKGASVKVTDYPILAYLREMLNGNSSYTLDNLIALTAYILPTLRTQLAPKGYVDHVLTGLIGTASNTTAGGVKTDQNPNSLPRVKNVYVQQQSSPNMTVKVLPINAFMNEFNVSNAGGNTGTITAPVSNPRIDLVVIQSSNNTIQVRTGSENASPVVPTPTSGDVVLAEIYNRVGETSIKDQDDSTNGYIQKWHNPHLYRNDLVIFSGTTTGSSNAYALAAPAGTTPTLFAGLRIAFISNFANTAAATLNFAGLGAKSITKLGTTALTSGDIGNGQAVLVEYDGTQFQMLSPTANTPQATSSYFNTTTTKNVADSSTSQTIAHGLGVAPKWVKVTAYNVNTGTLGINGSIGYYDVGGQNCVYFSGTTTAIQGTDTVALHLLPNGSSTGNNQTGSIAVDATNITITWTKAGSPVGSFTILVEAGS